MKKNYFIFFQEILPFLQNYTNDQSDLIHQELKESELKVRIYK